MSEIFKLRLTALKSNRSLNSLSPACGFIRQSIPLPSAPRVRQFATNSDECNQPWVQSVLNNKLNHTKNPQKLEFNSNKGDAPNYPSIDFPNWQDLISPSYSGFSNGFPCVVSAGGISASTSQQPALQISSNSRGFVFFHIPKFNRPNSPGRGLKIIIDSLLLLSS